MARYKGQPVGGLADVTIFASGGRDEDYIDKILQAGAPIDGFGVGTDLTTSADAPALDCAYKLQEYAGLARRKRSTGKATWPGRKQVWRRYGADGLQILGISIDQPEAVARYRQAMKINYPLLLADETTFDLMAAYGNRQGALPYSVLIRTDGRIAATRVGVYEVIAAGAVGNLYDRVRWSRGVVDFIGPIDLGIYDFPIFNVADIAITCGAILLAWSFLMEERAERAAAQGASGPEPTP